MIELRSSLGLWVHETQSALGAIGRIKSLGFDWLGVKIADGANPYQAVARRKLAAQAAACGRALVAWAYVRPADIDAQIRTITANLPPNCVHLILDAEAEWEGAAGTAEAAETLCSGLAAASAHRVSLHLSSFYAVSLHPCFPYAAFAKHCASFMPQAYQEDATDPKLILSRTLETGRPPSQAFLNKALIPTFNTPALLELGAASGVGGASVWLWDGAGADIGVRGREGEWSPAIDRFKAPGRR